ncbi:hypothetical protein SNEBB_009138 [Seison nebaliae]|nr:hypothetical protein SNEBB_009138 [Seison nebaliae]
MAKRARKIKLDMFAEDEDDFDKQLTEENKRKVAKNDKNRKNQEQRTTDADNDVLDDERETTEGYYHLKNGDELDKGRYSVEIISGQGVFSSVVKARDLQEEKLVAIKIIRTNDLMYRKGLEEIEWIRKINRLDENNKSHCIQLLRHFIHKRHLCIVLECMSLNLREALKRFGGDIGLNIKAVRLYCYQLLLALRHLRRCGVVHADIKPDNILINEARTVLKLTDFGSACNLEKQDPTPYLVSRYYRAPEIILGADFDYGIDMWSTGVTVFELYTSRIMFRGESNNEMLRLIQQARGRIPIKVLRRSQFRNDYFDDNNNFISTHQKKIKILTNIPRIDIYSIFANERDQKVLQLKDLIDRMLMPDPTKRFIPSDALQHSFITEKTD